MKLYILSLFLILPSLQSYCWKNGYHVKPVTDQKYCPSGYQFDNEDIMTNKQYCHQICDEGYEAGPVSDLENHCYQKCPSGFPSSGVEFCLLPNYYERIEYYIYNNCLNDNPQGCQAIGISWYPKCAQNFYPEGAYCLPRCPDDMPLFKKKWCQRQIYVREKIRPIEGCDSDKNYTITDGLCYEQCKKGFTKSLSTNFCWKICEEDDPEGNNFVDDGFLQQKQQQNIVDCGAFCTNSFQECEKIQLSSQGLDVEFIERIYSRDQTHGKADMNMVIYEIQELYPELKPLMCMNNTINNYTKPQNNTNYNPFEDDWARKFIQ